MIDLEDAINRLVTSHTEPGPDLAALRKRARRRRRRHRAVIIVVCVATLTGGAVIISPHIGGGTSHRVVVGAPATVGQPSSDEPAAGGPVINERLPTTVAAATPSGWVPIDRATAQLSVPTSWAVSYQEPGCTSDVPGMLAVDPPSGSLFCGDQPYWPKTVLTIGGWHAQSLAGAPHREINGLEVYELAASTTGAHTWAVPTLDTLITEHGPLGGRVLDTLTTSPRAAVLTGTAPQPPSSWRKQTYAGISFATPPHWSTRHSTQAATCTSAVALGQRQVINQVIEPQQAIVDLDSDKTTYDGSCPQGQFQEIAPGNGVAVNKEGALFDDNGDLTTDRRIHLRRAIVYINTTDPYDILDVEVIVAGLKGPVDMQIGLSGNGAIARTILYSIHGT